MSDRNGILDVILQAPAEDEVSSHFELGTTALERDLRGDAFPYHAFVVTRDDRRDSNEFAGTRDAGDSRTTLGSLMPRMFLVRTLGNMGNMDIIGKLFRLRWSAGLSLDGAVSSSRRSEKNIAIRGSVLVYPQELGSSAKRGGSRS